MINPGFGNVLNDAAETIGGGDDFIDGITHFAKKDKSDEERAKIDEAGEDFKAIGKIVKGGLKWITMGVGVVVAVKFLVKK